MNRIVCFGDYIGRINPIEQYKFIQTNQCEFNYTGAEANVCSNLAQFGMKTEFITRLPQNIIGNAALSSLKKNGVGTDYIARGGERLGLFYVEKGSNIRRSEVVYDRVNSSFTNSCEDDYDWEKILDNAECLILSGITIALGENLYKICLEAVKAAKEKNVKVFFDINYRSKLWAADVAKRAIKVFIPYIDVLISNEEHAELLLDIRSDITEDDYDLRLEEKSKKIAQMYNIENVVITVRNTINADRYKIWASFYRENEFAISKTYNLRALDRIGSGDALTSGIVFSLLHGFTVQKVIDFAVAASALKHTIKNDVNYIELQDVYNLLESSSFEVSR